MEFLEEVAALSGGLPLVLEVWSRYFIGHERKQWPSLLEKLKRIPHGDVQKQLQMSYDSLSVTAKNLFLDIACFFDGRNKELVFKVLHDEESAFFPDIEIQHLVDKFLVKYISQNQLMVAMNQVIREMGQEVIRQENVDEPGKRTRLISRRDILGLFRDCSGTDSVRSINFNSSHGEEPVTLQLEAFKTMSNLRFIKLNDRDRKLQWSFSSKDVIHKARSCFSFKHLKYLVRKRNKVTCKSMSACFSFKHLKYLEWDYFPCKSLDNIDMGNVVFIKLKGSKLEKLWEGVKVKNFKKLKILDVSESTSLAKTGNFIGLENLEKLNLYGCKNLKELDSSIGSLHKLVYLNLQGCRRLKRLPWESIGKLKSLQNLDLYFCYNLLESSHEVSSLSYNKFSSLPNSLFQLHQLTQLNLSYCTNLKSIPDLPLNIEYLNADECINLVNLPSNCSELQFLAELSLNRCYKLGSKGFTQVTGLRNLDHLSMKYCNVSQVSSDIGNMVSLWFLDLSGNTFSSLPESFSNLSKLETLYINECSQLQLLPPLPSQLRKIYATYCGSLDVMPFDSMQNAYTVRSKVFNESLTSTEGLHIDLSEEELPEWCTYQNSGNNIVSFVAPNQFDSKICGLILCATRVKYDIIQTWFCPTIHNKTKGTSHQFHDYRVIWCSMMVNFYPLNDTTLVVEVGDTVELQFHVEERVKSGGLRLIYEDDVVDSGLLLKDVRKTTPSNSITQLNDEGAS